MSQFMQQKRDEKQDRRRHGQAQDNAIAPLRIAAMKFGGKRKHNQEGDQKPAIVQPNFDSKDSSELDLRSQVGYLLRSAHRRAALPDFRSGAAGLVCSGLSVWSTNIPIRRRNIKGRPFWSRFDGSPQSLRKRAP